MAESDSHFHAHLARVVAYHVLITITAARAQEAAAASSHVAEDAPGFVYILVNLHSSNAPTT